MGAFLDSIAKALAGALAGAAVTYSTVILASSPGGEAITSDEWGKIGLAALGAGLAVWLVPNTPKTK